MAPVSSFAGPDDAAVLALLGTGQSVLVTVADRPKCSGTVITVLVDDVGRPAMLVLDNGAGLRGINWSHIVWIEPPPAVPHPGLA